MLYTGKEIAEQYSTKEVEITENTVRRWANNRIKTYNREKRNLLVQKRMGRRLYRNRSRKENELTNARRN